MSGPPEFVVRGITLKREYFALSRKLVDRLLSLFDQSDTGRVVVGIGGESGSGKSITALCTALELRDREVDVEVLHLDDYFRLPPKQNMEARARDLGRVGPQEVDLRRLNRHIDAFRVGGNVEDVPIVDYVRDCFRARSVSFATTRVLIVEGTYVLAETDTDVGIFLEGQFPETYSRRRERNRDPDDPLIEEVLSIEHTIIQPQSGLADIIVDVRFRIVEGR